MFEVLDRTEPSGPFAEQAIVQLALIVAHAKIGSLDYLQPLFKVVHRFWDTQLTAVLSLMEDLVRFPSFDLSIHLSFACVMPCL